MGLFDNIMKKKTPVEKAQKDLTEPYAQPDVRLAAMNKLLEIGTEAAYDALLKRFTFTSNGHIADEREKRDLIEELAKIGAPAVPSIKRFIAQEKLIGFPISALSKILSKEDVTAFLIETLKSKEPLDHRSTDAKKTLILAISERASADQAVALVPYLDDHHDDVQFTAVEAIQKLKNPATADALSSVCVGDSHSARIQRRAAVALMQNEWPAGEKLSTWNEELRSEYTVNKSGVVVRSN